MKGNIAAAFLRELVSRVLFDDMIAVLDDDPHDAALNMAIDEMLLRAARCPTLRIYRWLRPSLSFGYFGKWSDAVASGSDREIVRRWTGGGIVLHGEDVTFSIIVPRTHSFFATSPGESYRLIHQCVASALGNATLAAVSQPKASSACFENPVRHDVLVAERKVVGGAQRRAKWGLLHQGSIQEIVAGKMLAAELVERFASRPITIALPREIEAAAASLTLEKYATGEWSFRIR